MYLNQRTKKLLKVLCLVAFVFVLTGCTANLDQNGQLIAERAITSETAWSLKAGFILTIPLAKGIIFIESMTGNVAWGVIIVTLLVNIILLPLNIKSTISM